MQYHFVCIIQDNFLLKYIFTSWYSCMLWAGSEHTSTPNLRSQDLALASSSAGQPGHTVITLVVTVLGS